jgi:RNA polymerase sigma-70 factor (ECF subfamily)
MLDLTPVFAHRAELVRTALYHTRDRLIAEDIVQDAFVCALRWRGEMRDPTKLLGWMHRVVMNCAKMAVQAMRRQKRGGGVRMIAFDELPARGEHLPAPRQDRWWEGDRRWELLERLSPTEREMLEAIVIDEVKLKDWGAATGRKHNTVKTDIFRLRRRLQADAGPAADEARC